MGERNVPVYSTLEDDLELREEISEFVIGLAERIDTLQDAESAPDPMLLVARSRSLVEDARRFGYAALAAVGEEVVSAREQDKPQVVREKLLELTELARRVRLGHRGAAG